MAHRIILTERQRAALFDLPTDEADLLRHYTLADDDLEHIRARRRSENRMGFALQLCALRYPGRLLSAGEVISERVLAFIGAQLGLTGDALLSYAARRQTRQQHLKALQRIYGYRMFSGRRTRDLKAWLDREAEAAQSNEDLARRFVKECRRTQTILPGVSRIERLCADALVAAERRIEARTADRLNENMRTRLNALLTEPVDGNVSRLIWLRRFETGKNSADMNRLLDRLEFLRNIGLDAGCLAGVPPHRITRLRRQGERYFTDGLQDISGDRHLAILAVCAVEWRSAIADTIVETHDRIVGKTWRDAKRLCDTRIIDAKASVQNTLRAFFTLGAALLTARSDDGPLDEAVATSCGWDDLEKLVASSAKLTDTMDADPLAQVAQGYHRFRRYPRQHDLAIALREIGRVERTLFIIEWLLDTNMQRRAQIGLNKGEAHHALKNALRIGRQGELRDRTAEGQHYRMAGLNLLAAIVIYWNTLHLGQAVAARRRAGLVCSPNLLAHTSPLGWAHILLTGEYRWPKR